MIFHSEDRVIFRDLYKEKEGLDIYFFHDKYLLSPAQISRFFIKYSILSFISKNDDKLCLTEIGRKWVLSNRRKIFYEVGEQYWKNPSSREQKYTRSKQESDLGHKLEMKKLPLKFFGHNIEDTKLLKPVKG